MTICKPGYAYIVTAALPEQIEAARLAALAVRIAARADRVEVLKRMFARASRKQWKNSTTWWSGAGA